MRDVVSGCLEDVTIAAFIDGRLPAEERAAVEAHLASCEDCYRLLADTARFIQAEAQAAVVPLRRPARSIWTVALPLAAAAGLALFALWRSREEPVAPRIAASRPSPQPVGAASLLAESADLGRLEDAAWSIAGAGYGFAPSADDKRLAVLLGVSETDRLIASKAGRKDRAEQAERRAAGLRQALGKTADAKHLVLGEWLEAARLAAVARDARFLSDPRTLAALGENPGDLAPAAAGALNAARELLRAVPDGDADWRRLEASLRDAILLM